MNYQDLQNRDLSFGYKSEEEIHQILENVFGKLLRSKLNPEMGEYYEFDKYSEDFFIEVKTRRILHDKFESLFFGENKLRKGDDILKKFPNIRIFYLWRCEDGIFGWEHRSTAFTIQRRGRCDRGRNEYNDCVDVLQENIKPLNELLN